MGLRQRVGEQRREPQRRERRWSPARPSAPSWSRVVSGSIGGIAKALLSRQSTLPNSSRARSTSARQASSSVMSVRYDECAAAVRAHDVGHLRRAGARCARRAPGRRPSARPPRRASGRVRGRRRRARRPCPGAAGHPGFHRDHPSCHAVLAGLDAVGAARLGWLIVGVEAAGGSGRSATGTTSHLGPSASVRSRARRCQRSIITPCGWPHGLEPVGDARVALADHVAQHAVRVGARLRQGERRLVVLVVGGDVPPRCRPGCAW